MSDEVYFSIIPYVHLDDERKNRWDEICDLMIFENTCLSNHFENKDEASKKIKELKNGGIHSFPVFKRER